MFRTSTYAALWAFAIAFGWIEASVVVYLREVLALQGTPFADEMVPLVSVPQRLLWVEIVREAATMFMLAAAGWLASPRWAGRFGGFLLVFGVWDLVYYAVLWLVLGWPESLFTWDLLFLIPLPWVAPVWAPASVALAFIGIGTWLLWTPERSRRYRMADAAVFVAAALIIILSFLAERAAVVEGRTPESFPLVVFWLGVLVGVGWFVRAERGVESVRGPGL